MAVYTEVSEEALFSFLEQYENLGSFLSLEGIAEGVENSNYRLKTDKAVYILTLYERRVKEEDLPFFLSLMEYTASFLSCPRPIKKREGRALGRLAGRPAALFSFLEGRACHAPDPEACAQLGSILASFHRVGLYFPLRRPNALSIPCLPALFAPLRETANSVSAGLSEEIDLNLCALLASWPSDLPRGIIHGDLFPDNVFFKNGRISGIIDFYFSCEDSLAYDLAICITAWCFGEEERFHQDRAEALIRGYEGIRKLSFREKESLPLLCRGASLRFLLTRLHDWLHNASGPLVRRHDPLIYLEKLRFFAKSFSLERSLQFKTTRMGKL